MATLRDILRKIGAVKKTRQITRAMSMVAAAKLRGAQTRMEGFEPYARKFAEVLGNLAMRIEPDVHPLLVKRDTVARAELLHFTGDRGLCGSFNMNTIKHHANLLRASAIIYRISYNNFTLITFGAFADVFNIHNNADASLD